MLSVVLHAGGIRYVLDFFFDLGFLRPYLLLMSFLVLVVCTCSVGSMCVC